MKKQLNNVPLDIPEYINLRDRSKCKNCKHRMLCGNVDSKLQCEKFGIKFFAIELLFFIIPEGLGIWWIYSKLKDIMEFILFSLVYSIIIFLLQFLISYIACKISKSRETKRKAKYDRKVEKIMKINEKIERKNRGETEEYLNFVTQVSKVTEKFIELNNSIEGISNFEELAENKIVEEKFKTILEKLVALTENINPTNYNSNSANLFYKAQLELVIEKTEKYINLYNQNKLTSNQITEFNKLLDTVIKKIDKHTQYVLKIEEEKFISEIQKLNQNISLEEE